MKTGILDINSVEICVGDKVRKVNRLDNVTIWTVIFNEVKANINGTYMTIYTFLLVDDDGYDEIMETEIHWKYTQNDETEYEIIK